MSVKPTDMLDRELNVGDFVVSYNNIYEIKAIGESDRPKRHIRMVLIEPSKTTRPVNKYTGEVCKVDSSDVVAWKLTRGY